jgi:diguanylate cyclase (GGDEF)-like protein/PAS domain S-box-containing protein
MPENAFSDEGRFFPSASSGERDHIFQQALGLERELMKTRRAEKVLREMERRYLSLMDSAVFLYALLTPDGAFRLMNRRAEEFFGVRLQSGTELTLHSLAGPGYLQEVDSMLEEAMEKPVHVTFPVARSGGSLGWLEIELSCSVYQGDDSVQIIASDITNLMEGKADAPAFPSPSGDRRHSDAYAVPILDSCPGFLCFAVDKSGDLLYATRGYREISKRFMRQECVRGRLYPRDTGTAFAGELRALVQDAILGRTALSTIVEEGENGRKQWNVTAAPLTGPGSDEVLGAVVHLTSLLNPAEAEKKPSAGAVRDVPSRASFLNAVPEMLCVVDDEGRCLDANDRFLSVLRMPGEAVIGHSFEDLALQGDLMNDRLSEKIVRAIREGFPAPVECKIRAGDDEILFLSLRGGPAPWGADAETLISCTDNTRLRRTEDQLRRVSTTDVSTGLLNRQGMERALSAEIGRASTYGDPLALILLDVDDFRGLNSRIGYAAGDQVLRDLAALLKSQVRLTDALGRWGGDEFMLLTPLPAAPACRRADAILNMARKETFGESWDGKEKNRLTLSAGVAEYRKGVGVADFVASAFDALLAAKRKGGDRYEESPGYK